jgi:tungstate transport system substrate-binding protein
MPTRPVFALLTLLLAGCGASVDRGDSTRPPVLRLAVTTSTRDSGLMDVLVAVFEAEHGARVDVIAVGTGAALKLGAAGDVDVVLVHARAAEDAWMAAGHGIRREDVMYNTFEILGPPSDPAGIRDLEPAEALRKIAADGQRFVSRGDNSGTHQREQQFWDELGGRPRWGDYVESGQGMGATLTMANQLNAYVLADRGTYLKFKNKMELIPLVTTSQALHNPYGIMVVDPQKNPQVHAALANAFVDFIISAKTQRLIRDFEIDGERLFFPLRLANETE